MMKAAVVRRHGGPEALVYSDVPRPEPRHGEVLVRVSACAVNRLDVWVRLGRRGRHPIGIDLPRIPGADVCGVVEEIGDGVVTIPEPGARVILHPSVSCGHCMYCAQGRDNLCEDFATLGVLRDGGYAEFVSVPAVDLIPAPAHLDDAQAACLPLVNMTAWDMIVSCAGVQAGEWVLVQAAGSGVGSAAIQLAKALGARVIATASTEAKLQKAKELGADHVIDYTDGFAPQVMEITEGHGADVVVESVGSSVFVESMDALASGGRLTSCGATADARVAVDLHLIQGKRASFHFVVMGSRGDLRHALRVIETHHLEPALDRTVPLAEAPAAHAALEQRAQFGKIVLVP